MKRKTNKPIRKTKTKSLVELFRSGAPLHDAEKSMLEWVFSSGGEGLRRSIDEISALYLECQRLARQRDTLANEISALYLECQRLARQRDTLANEFKRLTVKGDLLREENEEVKCRFGAACVGLVLVSLITIWLIIKIILH